VIVRGRDWDTLSALLILAAAGVLGGSLLLVWLITH